MNKQTTIFDLQRFGAGENVNTTVGYTNAETDTSTCSTVGLGQRVKFNTNILSTFKAQEAATFLTVINQIAVCIIVQNDNIILLCKCNQFMIEAVGSERSGGVIGIRKNQQELI